MTPRIGIIDYGMGNLFSVEKAFNRLNQSIIRVNNPKDLINCKALILPGVGSFDPAMENLKKTNLIPYLNEWVKVDKPLLGICLGLQLLFESSEEGNSNGLGFLKGKIKRLPNNNQERIPHMGWSKLTQKNKCPLLNATENDIWTYFVHSYSAIPLDNSVLAATTTFGDKEITAVVWEKNLGACQFHPEKSGKAGKKLLERWLKWLKENPTFSS